MRTHRSRASLLVLIDTFICLCSVFVLVLNKPVADVQQQVAAKKAEVAALEARVKDLRADRDVVEADITAVKGQVEVEREQLAKRQAEYQNWDIVVKQFTHYADLDSEPDYHFYLRTNGIYSSASGTKWTKAGLQKWLSDVGSQTPEGSRTEMVFYAENGTNDLVIYTRGVIDTINDPTVRILAHYVTLPPGATAGPDRIIHANQGGGK